MRNRSPSTMARGGSGPARGPSCPHPTTPADGPQGSGDPIPQARDSELAIAGALLWFGDEVATQVLAELRAEDFYSERVRQVFLAAQALVSRGEVINPISIREELRRAGEPDEDWTSWAMKAADTLLSVAFLPAHIRAVREAARRRQMRATLLEALDRITTQDPGALATELAERLTVLGCESGPGRKPVLMRLADVKPEEVLWLWEPYIPRGKITLLEGDPGVGKSWLALTLAAIVSKGSPFPGPDGIPRQEQVREPANVLYLSAEDGLTDTIRTRLDSAGADVARVYVLAGWTAQGGSGEGLDGYVTLQDVALLEEALNRIRPALLVVDPVQGFLGGIDAWRAEQVRPTLARIGELATRYGCAVLLIRHLSKSAKDRAIYRGLGSIDFSAAARSVLAVVRKEGERGIIHLKSSLAAEGPSIGFDIRDGQFFWTGLSKLTKADVNAPEQAAEERTQAEECAEFLREALADGPRPAQELIRLAKQLGHSERTIDNAKVLAGVKARSRRGPDGRLAGWEWYLPEHTTPPPEHYPTANKSVRSGEWCRKSFCHNGFARQSPERKRCALAGNWRNP